MGGCSGGRFQGSGARGRDPSRSRFFPGFGQPWLQKADGISGNGCSEQSFREVEMRSTVLGKVLPGWMWLVACILFWTALVPVAAHATPACPSDGDVYPLDKPDGAVTLGDALVVLRLAGGLDAGGGAQVCRADVGPLAAGAPHPDGKVALDDAVLVLQRAAGLLSWRVQPPPAALGGEVTFRDVPLPGARVSVYELYTQDLVHQTLTDQQGGFTLPPFTLADDKAYLVEIDSTAGQDPNLQARIHALWFPGLSPTVKVNYLSEAVWRHVRASYRRIPPRDLRAYLDQAASVLLKGAPSFAEVQTFAPYEDAYRVRHDLLSMLDADIAAMYAQKTVSEADLAMFQLEATRGELPADADLSATVDRREVLLSLRTYGQGEVRLDGTRVGSGSHAAFVARGSTAELLVKPAAGYRLARVQGCGELAPAGDGFVKCTLTATADREIGVYFVPTATETVKNLYDLSASDVAFTDDLLRVVPGEPDAALVAGLEAGDFVYRTKEPVFLLKIEGVTPLSSGVYEFSVRPARLEEVIAKGGGYGNVFVVPDALRDVPEGVPVRSALQGRDVYLVRTPRTMLDGTFYILFPRQGGRSPASLLNTSYTLPSIRLGPEGQPALEISGALAVRMGVEFYVDLGWFSIQEVKMAPWVEMKPTLDLKFLVQYTQSEPLEKKARVIEGSSVVWIGVVPLVVSMGLEAGLGVKDAELTVVDQQLRLSASLKFKYGLHYRNGSLEPVFDLDPRLSMDFQKSLTSNFLSGKLFAYVLLAPYVKIYRGLVYFGLPLRTGPQVAFSAFTASAGASGAGCTAMKASVAGVFSAKPELKAGSCGKLCDALRLATQHVDRYLPEYTLTFAKQEYSPADGQCALGGRLRVAADGQQEFRVRHGASFSQPVTLVLKNTGDQDLSWTPAVRQGKYVRLDLPPSLPAATLAPGAEARIQATLRLAGTPPLEGSLQAVDEAAIGFTYDSGDKKDQKTADLRFRVTVVKGLAPPTVTDVTARREGLAVSWTPPANAPDGVSYFVAAKVRAGADCGQDGYVPVLQAPAQGQPVFLPLSKLQRILGDLQGKTVCVSMYSTVEEAVSDLFSPAKAVAVDTQLQYQLALLGQTYEDWWRIRPDQGDPNQVKELEQRWRLEMSATHGASLVLEQAGDCGLDITGGTFFADAQAGAEFELAVGFARPRKPGVYYCRFEVRDRDGGLYRIGSDDVLRLLVRVERGRVYAYALHYSGMKAIDVTDPSQPQVVWQTGGLNDLMQMGWTYRNGRYYLFVTDGNLRIFDMTDPENVTLLPVYADGISGPPVFYGNVAFFSGGTMVDISDMSHPMVKTPFNDAGYYPTITWQQLVGSTLYTLDAYQGELEAWDISSPYMPKRMTVQVPQEDGTTMDDPYACPAQASRFAIYGNKYYYSDSYGNTWSNSLQYPDCGVIVDFKENGQLRSKLKYEQKYENTGRACSSTDPEDLAGLHPPVIANGRIFLANGCEFLILNADSLTVSGRLGPDEIHSAKHVAVLGSYAYLSDNDGLKIIDVDTSPPKVVSVVDMDGNPAGQVVVLEQ